MELTPKDIAEFINEMEEEMERSRLVPDKELGWVFYPCSNALFEALNRSMA